MVRNPWVLALYDFLVKTLHIICSKWRVKRTHLIEHTAKRPNVTFGIVRHIPPNFRARVIRCSCLCVTEALLNDLRYVEISKFSLHVPVEENVRTLHISMKNFSVVQGLEPTDYLNENVPYLLLFDVGLPFLVATYFLEDITVVGVFHDQTKVGIKRKS